MSNHITSDEFESIKKSAAHLVPGATLQVVAFPGDLMDFTPPRLWRLYEYRNGQICQLTSNNWYHLTIKSTLTVLKGRLLIETQNAAGKRVLHIVK